MRKQPEITQKTRQTFFLSFCQLYEHQPIEHIRVQKLCELAGYNRSTFYQYFLDIYDLRDQAEAQLLGAMKDSLSQYDYQTPAIRSEVVLNFFTQEEAFLRALLGRHSRSSFIEQLSQLITQELTLLNERLHPYLAEFYSSTLISLYQKWLRETNPLPLSQLLELIHELYMHGISGQIDRGNMAN